jgi:hypothetical protein
MASSLSRFLAELKRRKVYHVAGDESAPGRRRAVRDTGS